MPGVYISYPFCSQKCSFCNFASGVFSSGDKARYLDVLRAEIAAHEWQWLPETLYLGGGTPSLLAPGELGRILEPVPQEALVESTMECAPGTLSPALALEWRRLGINRVSLGVQSFAVAELRQTGRRHTAETVAQDVEWLRQAGIENINIDLITGLPGQTTTSWSESLQWVERLRPPHVSVYIFEIDEDSRLGKETLGGGIRYGAAILPGDDAVTEFYETARHRLGEAGIARYEISNFAMGGYQSRHNLKYWKREPYVGFGLDAHSFDGRVRTNTPDNLSAYLASAAGGDPQPTDAAEEHFFVGLRLAEGITPSAEERERFAQPIRKWLEYGMLLEDGGMLRLSDRGVLVSNEILQEFICV